jgi:hypothetical protein
LIALSQANKRELMPDSWWRKRTIYPLRIP